MKLLFTSDEHHHKWPAFASPLPAGRTTRFAEGLEVEHWVSTHVPHHVRFRGGDLFHRKDILDAVVFNDVLDVLAQDRRPQYILAGNHCAAAGGLRYTIEGLRLLPHVRVVTQPAVYTLADRCVAVACIPYLGDATRTRAAVEQVCAQLPSTATTRVLLAHTAVAGARLGSEYVVPEELTVEDLRPDVFTHVCIGHCHEPQALRANVWHIGSLLQRSFADVGQPRRVLVLDTETGQMDSVAVPGPRFLVRRAACPTAVTDWDELVDHYVKIVCTDITTPPAQWTDAAAKTRGCTLVYDVQEAPAPGAAMQPLAQGLAAHMAAYVAQATTTLDRSRLLQVGQDLVAEA